MKKVFLMDTGVNINQLKNDRRINTYIIKNGEVVEDNCCKDVLGHGTAIANTLLKNNDIELNVIKIFDDDYTCKAEKLIIGLNFISKIKNVYLIHMSLGTRRYNCELENICKKLYKKGVVLVAACDNGMVMSYPAAFDFVISVAPSYRCISTEQFVYVKNSPINLKAKAGGQQILSVQGENKLIQTGASFAAAHVSSKILSWNEALGQHEILQKFEKDAVYKYDFEEEPYSQKLFHIENAVIFPFNKENHSLIRFDDLLDFKIRGIYDIKYSGQVGKKVKSFSGKEYEINDIKHCNWDNFDTFILGHVDELSIICNENLKSEIIELCEKHHKKLYMYDDFNLTEFDFHIDRNGANIFYPKNSIRSISNKFGWYYQHTTPIIAVLGTSKKQGKFTLQLQLRKIFLNKGINIGQLGTEPSSLLFGMDEMFTLGYFSNNKESIDAITETLNQKIHNIDLLNKEIIITGSQSSFLPYNSYNNNIVNFMQFAFLYAVVPDGIILAVNINDDFDYIKRTINTVWNMTKSRVFALAIYPFDVTYERVIDSQKKKLSQSQLSLLVEQFEKYFKIPTIVIGESFYEEKIFNIVCKFFE